MGPFMITNVLAMALQLSPLMIGGIALAGVVVLGANVYFGMMQRQMMNNKEDDETQAPH